MGVRSGRYRALVGLGGGGSSNASSASLVASPSASSISLTAMERAAAVAGLGRRFTDNELSSDVGSHPAPPYEVAHSRSHGESLAPAYTRGSVSPLIFTLQVSHALISVPALALNDHPARHQRHGHGQEGFQSQRQ